MGSLHRTAGLVRLDVMLGDIRLGAAVDALFDGALRRLVGIEVRGGDGAQRFLPLPACDVREDRLAVDSALVFLERDLDFYRAGGRSFRSLLGEPVTAAGIRLGTLADLLVTGDGDVVRLVVAGPDGPAELAWAPDLAVGNDLLRPAV